MKKVKTAIDGGSDCSSLLMKTKNVDGLDVSKPHFYSDENNKIVKHVNAMTQRATQKISDSRDSLVKNINEKSVPGNMMMMMTLKDDAMKMITMLMTTPNSKPMTPMTPTRQTRSNNRQHTHYPKTFTLTIPST